MFRSVGGGVARGGAESEVRECDRGEIRVSGGFDSLARAGVPINDDGNGGRTTVECDTNNNTDMIEISECTIVN